MTDSTIPDFDEYLQRMASRDSLVREMAFQHLRPYAPQFAEELVQAYRAATDENQRYLLFVLLIESQSSLARPIIDEVQRNREARLQNTLYQLEPSHGPPDIDERQLGKRLPILFSMAFIYFIGGIGLGPYLPYPNVFSFLLTVYIVEELIALMWPGFLRVTTAGRDLTPRDRGVMLLGYGVAWALVAMGTAQTRDWVWLLVVFTLSVLVIGGVAVAFGSQQLRNQWIPRRFRK